MGSKDWLQKNFGDFLVYAPLEDLQKLNLNFSGVSAFHVFPSSDFIIKNAPFAISKSDWAHLHVFSSSQTILHLQLATLDLLSPDQKAELVLDPSTGALENVTVLREIFMSIMKSPANRQLDGFFQAFVILTGQVSE